MAEFEPAMLSPFGQVRLQFGDRKLQVRASDLTVQTLAKIFHLLPETIILVSEQGTVAVPDDNGRFSEVDDFLMWRVEGDASSVGLSGARFVATNRDPSNPGSANTATISGSSSSKWKPKTFAPRAQRATAAPVSWQKSIEIWRLVGGQLVQRQEHPITLVEDTAIVKKVAERISSEAFEGAPVVLLNSKNMPIPDVEGTQGSKFWRTAKIIKAMRQGEFDTYTRKQPGPTPNVRRQIIDLSDSDSDVQLPTFQAKRRKPSPAEPSRLPVILEKVEAIYNKLESLESTTTANILQKVEDTYEKLDTTGSVVTATLSELQELKAAHDRVHSDSSWRELFQCLVCRGYPSAAKDSVVTPCCRAAVSCKTCLAEWLENSATCPNCRENLEMEQCETLPIIRPLLAAFETSQE